ncbi:MAG: hypothetical protein B7Y02_00650 [Rhodobacterales bacterium 17-64-5]|nr:MAG: hypothetical protein B7Y02_00650 [Rhodobacterales bacterium 17-64-5]
MRWTGTRLRELFSVALRQTIIAVAVFGSMAITDDAVMAQTTNAIVVRSDGGGFLGQRSDEIKYLRATGQRVELIGTCISACTMYLSLPNACVSPTAVFGFHGPSGDGQSLSPEEFEHWSEVMARNYREPLRSWYLSTARYEISGYYKLTGAQLINMGYQSC